MAIDVTKVIKTPAIRDLVPLMLEDLANSLSLKEEIPEKGMEILRKYNLISLTNIDEFERSFFRSMYAGVVWIDPENVVEGMKEVVYYTFDLSFRKYPELAEALERANREEKELECGIQGLLLFYTCQQFYRSMKRK